MTIVLIARILARYLAGILIGMGGVSAMIGAELQNDPDLVDLVVQVLTHGATLAGAGLSLLTEYLYGLARRYGWAT